MATSTRKLEVEIVGDASSLQRALGQASSHSSGFGRSLKTLGKVAAVGVGAAFAGLAVTLKEGFQELAEGQRVSAQTAAALKSTGGVANVTAKKVDTLAQSISRMSGIDDEAVQASENMLLTFTRVRNEVGKGNDIFDQATQAVADMATRMNNGAIPSMEQLSTTSIRIGKALNDPIKGVGALSRVGVQFTDAQKAMIEEMVKSGDVMGAQKIILKELETEFGGSAKAAGETLPGQLSKLRNSLAEAAGEIAKTLLPYLTQFLDWVNRNMPTIQRIIKGTLDAIVATIKFLVPIIVSMIDVFRSVRDATERYWPAVRQVVEGVISWFRTNVVPTVRAVVGALVALWEDFGDEILAVVEPAFRIIGTIIGTALNNIKAIIEFFMAVIRGDWGAAWDALKSLVSNTLNGIKTVLTTALTNLVPAILGLAAKAGGAILSGMKNGIDGAWHLVAGWFATLPGKITGFLANAGEWLFEKGKSVIAGLLRGLIDKWVDVATWYASLPGKIVNFLANAGNWLVEKGVAVIGGLLRGLRDKWADVSAWLEGLPGRVLGAIGDLGRILYNAGLAVMQGFLDGLKAGWDKVTGFLSGLDPRKWKGPEERDRQMLYGSGLLVMEGFQRGLESGWESVKSFLSGRGTEIGGALTNFFPWLGEASVEAPISALEDVSETVGSTTSAFDTLSSTISSLPSTAASALSALHETVRLYLRDIPTLIAPVEGAFNALAAAVHLVGQSAYYTRNALRDTVADILLMTRQLAAGGIALPGRQYGGPVRRNVPYVVGEAGPELFVPSTSGRIIAGATSGGVGLGVINLNFYGPAVGSDRQFEDLVRRALYDVGRRNPGAGV